MSGWHSIAENWTMNDLENKKQVTDIEEAVLLLIHFRNLTKQLWQTFKGSLTSNLILLSAGSVSVGVQLVK